MDGIAKGSGEVGSDEVGSKLVGAHNSHPRIADIGVRELRRNTFRVGSLLNRSVVELLHWSTNKDMIENSKKLAAMSPGS